MSLLLGFDNVISIVMQCNVNEEIRAS